jgi:transposase
MGQPVTITRTENTAGDLRCIAGKLNDGDLVCRLLALALILDGRSRTEAAEQTGMQRQTLRDWVHRYNDRGVDGLKSESSPGRSPVLTEEQMDELKRLVIKGPDPEKHGIVRWRCQDIQEEVAKRFSWAVHESTVGRWLHNLGLTPIQPRPFHPKRNIDAQEAFKSNFPRQVKEALPPAAVGKPLEIWFEDEARVGQQGTLGRIWAPVGSQPEVVQDNRRTSVFLFGAICPGRGIGSAIIMPSVNADAMNVHLKAISLQVEPSAHAALILDGAGWHETCGQIRVAANITLVTLLAYSPQLNPTEIVWDYLL